MEEKFLQKLKKFSITIEKHITMEYLVYTHQIYVQLEAHT